MYCKVLLLLKNNGNDKTELLKGSIRLLYIFVSCLWRVFTVAERVLQALYDCDYFLNSCKQDTG